MEKYASEKQYTLYLGSMLDVLDTLPENSVDAIVTDPPYEISFMSKGWDNTGIAFQVDTWKKCLRVLKPGGHLLAFNHSRTFHRMWVAIEDAGFEIRDTIMYLYGSGFPKSLNIAKAIDKMLGAEREVTCTIKKAHISQSNTNNGWKRPSHLNKDGTPKKTMDITIPSSPQAKQWDGYGTALKPSHEPICLARKPIAESSIAQNVLKWGVGGINIDGCRVATDDDIGARYDSSFQEGNSQFVSETATKSGKRMSIQRPNNINLGRFPANLIHDGSDEVVELFPDTGVSQGGRIGNAGSPISMTGTNYEKGDGGYGDSGSAARFFYTAKASQSDRDEGLDEFESNIVNDGRDAPVDNAFQRGETLRKNIHPTVKPTDLMQYLVRLVTPKGGVVLDPFMGSGSTGKAAMMENVLKGSNYHFIGIDMTVEYLPIAKARIEQGIHFEEREVTTIATDANGNKVKQVQSNIFDFLGESE